MKQFLLSILIAGLVITAQAAPKVIHYWHFNTLTTAYHNPGIPVVKANISTIDTNKAVIAYKLLPGTSSAYAGYIDNVAGTDTNNRFGITAAGAANNGYRMRNPSDSAYLQLYIPTKGYKNIQLSYVLESSSTASGQLTQNFDYSTDSGTTWKTSGLNITTLDVSQTKYQGTNWGMVNVNFSLDTANTNNNNRLVFRIKFAGNTSGTSGNNRFDNIVVEGDSLASGGSGVGVSSIPNNAASMLYPNPVHDQLNIVCAAGNKMVRIMNSNGQLVRVLQTTETRLQLNCEDLGAGSYFLIISKDQKTAETFSFIKE